MEEKFFQTKQYKRIVNNIERVVSENEYGAEISDTIINLFDYMIKKI